MIRTRRAIANTRKTSRPMHEAPDTPPNDQAEFGPMEDRVYDAYQDHRNRLLDGEQKLGESYDQYLLTLSGGAIGLSLAFLHDLVTPGAVRFAWMLATAWTLLVVTIFLVGAMMRVSQVGHERFRDILDEQCAKGGERYWARVRAEHLKCPHPRAVGVLNWASLITFSVGVGLLLVFALCNVSASAKG